VEEGVKGARRELQASREDDSRGRSVSTDGNDKILQRLRASDVQRVSRRKRAGRSSRQKRGS
jgi:hypothetical protein